MNNIKFEVVVTRHKGLVDYLNKNGFISDETVIIDHATPEAIAGKTVLGVLPHSLSCLCKVFAEIPLNLPPEMRGKELSLQDVEKYAGDIAYYVVQRFNI